MLYDKGDMWGKILEWEIENKGTLWDYCTTASSNNIKKAIQSSGAIIPESISSSIHTTLDKGKRYKKKISFFFFCYHHIQ